MPSRAKICGLTEIAAAEAAIRGGAAWLGFIFHPASPRAISAEQAAAFARELPGETPRVAVLVDPEDGLIERAVATLKPAMLQLHGSESPARLADIKRRFGLPVMKAIGVRTAGDIASAAPFAPLADYLLFDTKAPSGNSGGTGRTFDWTLLSHYKGARPWFLAGGLDASNVAEAIRLTGAGQVDASSRLERAPGIKDIAKLNAFLTEVARQP